MIININIDNYDNDNQSFSKAFEITTGFDEIKETYTTLLNLENSKVQIVFF